MAKRERTEEPIMKSTTRFIAEKRDAIMIDRDDLDTMWVMQPMIYFEIAERLALETSRRDEAANELKDVAALIDGELREDAEADFQKNGTKKPTETAIANMVRDDKRWKTANAIKADLEKNVALLGALRDTFTQRRYALQDLVTLHVSAYGMNSSSKPDRDARHADNRKALNNERKKRREDD